MTESPFEGFGERGGSDRPPALVVVDMTLGFTDPDSPLACDLESPVENIAKLLDAARGAGIPSSSPPSPTRRATNSPPPRS